MNADHPCHLLELVERRPTVCSLSKADVEHLRLRHRTQVQVAPTGDSASYCVTSLGYVGIIVCPDTRLLLRPKIPLVDLFTLLHPDCESKEDDLAGVVPGAEALNFLAGRLILLLRERLALGLQRGYEETVAVGTSLRGRLDVTAQARQGHLRRDQLHSRFEEFTADIPCNQILRATSEFLMRSPWLAEGRRASLGALIGALSDVSPITVDSETIQKLLRGPNEQSYSPILALCNLILSRLRPDIHVGTRTLPAFLLNMDLVFEQYVSLGLRSMLPRQDLMLQPSHLVAAGDSVQPAWRMQPDLVFRRLGEIVTVLDTKWKVLRRDRAPTVDLYQMVAYCTALDCRHGILVYPGKQNRCWTYTLGQSGMTVQVRTLRVIGGFKACQQALRDLSRRISRRNRA